MALSPSIPTSFVPKQPVQPSVREPKAGWNILWIVALLMLALSVISAGGVFAYGKYLEGVRDTKIQALDSAKREINASTVEEFIRLRDRFISARGILDNHIVFSGFFDILEERTLQNVRFSSLTFTFDEDGIPEIEMSGEARSFNALAAQSRMLNEERRFKRAIFSDITVNANNTVSFSLSAKLDPSVLAMAQVTAPVDAPTDVELSAPATTTPESVGTSSSPTL